LRANGSSQRFQSCTLKSTAKTGTEDRIDHKLSPVQHDSRHRLDGPAPSLRMVTRFAPVMVERAEYSNANGPAGVDKMPGDYKAIAAIVTWSTQNDDGLDLPTPFDLLCDGATGTRHHFDGWCACGNRQTIGFGHLANAEQCRLAGHHVSQAALFILPRCTA
jgi:hypothetical protein